MSLDNDLEEQWRIIPSLPSYEASSLGRIRCLPWQGRMPYGGYRTYGGFAWKGCWDKKTQRYVTQIKGKTYRIAKMVCEAFHGPAPSEDACVLHKNEDSRDNTETNLIWGTQKENLNYPLFKQYATQACPIKMQGVKFESTRKVYV